MVRYRLKLGDCLELIKSIPDNSFSCTITSPPYNIGKNYDASNDTKEDYLEWLINVCKEISRVSQTFWLNIGYRKLTTGNIPISFQIYDKLDMFLMQRVIWEYDAGMTYKSRFNHRSEEWLWFVKNPQEYIFNPDSVRDASLQRGAFDKRNNPLGKLPGDVWFFNRVPGNSKERYKHPTQFPKPMIGRIIKASTHEDQIVFDPFMGTGTVGVSALELRRRFYGIEISENYFSVAKGRIENVVVTA